MRAVLAMEIAESSRGRRERSPKQEYLKQVLVYIGVEVTQIQRTWTL